MYLYTHHQWSKVSQIADEHYLNDGDIISIGRKLHGFGVIEKQHVDVTDKSRCGSYWKLADGYRRQTKRYFDKFSAAGGDGV